MHCFSACRQHTRGLVVRATSVHQAPAAVAAPVQVPAAPNVQISRPEKLKMPQGEPHTEYNTRWENMWTAEGGLKPGQAFDAATASPMLSTQLSSGALKAAGKRVLVPGCGRGYDLVESVRAGADMAVGLELAPTAQQAAALYLEQTLTGQEIVKAQTYAADFFKWKHPAGHTFDLGYDYTFLCALHPDMRADWAAAWAQLLHSGAQLACLAFPIDPERTTPGPPWPVTPQLYKDLLLPAGFVLEREEPVPAELSHPGRGGKECLLVFKRQ